jgi:alkylhydroperoxidase family enzyme
VTNQREAGDFRSIVGMTIHPADLELAVIEAIVARDTDPTLVELARERVAGLLLLGPSAATATTPRERAVGDFVDQFVIDVSGIDDALRGPLFEQLGDDALGFVQALYVVDLGIRRREVLRRLEVPLPDVGRVTAPDDLELWPALWEYMRTVARMSDLDAVTSEMVRLRGAAAHDCRICKSRLSIKAVEAYGSDAPFTSIVAKRPTDLSARHAAALAFVDAIITQPTDLDATKIANLRAHFSATEIHEMLHDVVRNSSNKFAVAVGGDAAVVESGIEHYDLDAEGDVVADVDADIVRSLTRV